MCRRQLQQMSTHGGGWGEGGSTRTSVRSPSSTNNTISLGRTNVRRREHAQAQWQMNKLAVAAVVEQYANHYWSRQTRAAAAVMNYIARRDGRKLLETVLRMSRVYCLYTLCWQACRQQHLCRRGIILQPPPPHRPPAPPVGAVRPLSDGCGRGA